MQWGSFSWDPDGYQNLPLTVRYPGWRSRGHPFYLFGFNEPDGAEQANITVAQAISLWPRLMASGLPLASPAAIGPTRQWMIDWMDEATARGYRIDTLSMHTYPGPHAASVVAGLEQFSADHHDRPVMLTGFGFVDWDQSSGWPENQLYHEMLELLWRLENSPACRRYALFGFIASQDWPQPADPTGNTYRSNWMNGNGTFTGLGELYMGWEGDTTPNADQPYILHNRAFDIRMRNDRSTTVDAVTIRTGDATAQVIFESIGNDYYYLVSSLDGKRLRRAGPNAVEWAPSTTAATDAQWAWSPVETGWHLVSNRDGGNLRYTTADGVHLGSGSGTYDHWFLVPPMNPVDNVAPAPPTGLTASPSHQQVTLEWNGSRSLDADAYTVRRSITPGGPYTTVASGVVAHTYADTGLVNGTPYYYVVATIDGPGQSGTSAEVSATPVAPHPVRYADRALVAFDGAPPGTDASASGIPDQDAHRNLAEFVFLLNPLVADSVDMGITAESDGDILLTFRVNRHDAGITVNLGCDDRLAGAPGWTNCPYSVRSQTIIGDQVELEVQAEDPPPNTAFFRIDARMD
jgi:hypothetical protein